MVFNDHIKPGRSGRRNILIYTISSPFWTDSENSGTRSKLGFYVMLNGVILGQVVTFVGVEVKPTQMYQPVVRCQT